jgi:hypothetical protein
MAILRALDGTFYEIPDDQAKKYKIPEDKLKEKLGDQAPTEGPPSEGPPESGASGPLVNVQIYYTGGGPGGAGTPETAVQPYDWRNWRNWRNWNNWRNHHDRRWD